ncbi:MAG: MotA/TolQ/ExbB proton channel family protein [Methylocella sp.]
MEILNNASGFEALFGLLPASFQEAGLVGKCVMGILAAASIWTWILIGEGLFVLIRLTRALKRASAGEVGHLIQPIVDAGHSACEVPIAQESPGELRVRIIEAMNRRAQELLTHAEGELANLAVIASVAPFIGLFGTVYGIMTSFANIGEAKDTSLAIVAPGIAEALAATAWGLAAAIPASIGYNRLGAALSRAGQKLGHLIEERAVDIVARRKPRSLKEVA